MSQMHAGALQADELLALYNLGPADLERIRKLGERVEPHLEEYISRLYEWLETQPEFDELPAVKALRPILMHPNYPGSGKVEKLHDLEKQGLLRTDPRREPE